MSYIYSFFKLPNVLGIAEGGDFSTKVHTEALMLNLKKCPIEAVQSRFWQYLVSGWQVCRQVFLPSFQCRHISLFVVTNF